MNEIQNSKPSRRWLRMFIVWLIFFAAFVIIVSSNWRPFGNKSFYIAQALIALAASTVMFGFWCLTCWGCQPRNLGRFLVGTACLATLAAIFYMEEDWRGKRAWEQCKTELEARGFEMDWDKCIPPPVPDDQNFFTASTNILLRFTKPQTDVEEKAVAQFTWLHLDPGSNAFPVLDSTKSKPLVVAELSFVPSAKAGSIAKYDDPATRNQIHDLLKKAIGRSVAGARGIQLFEFQLTNMVPARMLLLADTPPFANELEKFVSTDLATNFGHLRVAATGNSGTFQLLLTMQPYMQVVAAADYLKWSDQFIPAFDELREALKRPCAIIPGDYSRPYLIPIPNFVTVRTVAQMLAQRAQCDFLLGKPDEALHELTLIHDLCRILQKPPTGKPETLVESMINVAVSGLYASTIADGFHLHAWQEPELIALQQQLKTVNVVPFVAESVHQEVGASTHTLEISTPAEILKFLGIAGSKTPDKLWEKLSKPNFWLLHLAPRGWYYQNMVAFAQLSKNNADAFDLPNNLVLPRVSEANLIKINKALSHWSLWNFWADVAIPNLTKAAQTTAYNQTQVNEAQVACALERYHLANSEYPTTLDALVPQFIEQLPHDIIGGQPLHYRRVDDPSAQSAEAAGGKFLLYSVGWNEKDDGGLVGTLQDIKKGDWIWQ